jgi:hypothetical protein
VSWCLSGKNILVEKSFAIMMGFKSKPYEAGKSSSLCGVVPIIPMVKANKEI